MKARYVILAKCYDKRGRLLSVGTNSYSKTHPVQSHFAALVGLEQKKYLHAEVQALLRAKDRQVYRVTVERYSQDGLPMTATPCPVCMTAIRAFGVSEVSYTVTGKSSMGVVKL